MLKLCFEEIKNLLMSWISITCNRPEQLKMDFCLWSRAVVDQLISQEYGKNSQVRSIGKYLTRWGFTPQKPDAVQAWLEGGSPAWSSTQEAKEQKFTRVMRLRRFSPTCMAGATRQRGKHLWRWLWAVTATSCQ